MEYIKVQTKYLYGKFFVFYRVFLKHDRMRVREGQVNDAKGKKVDKEDGMNS